MRARPGPHRARQVGLRVPAPGGCGDTVRHRLEKGGPGCLTLSGPEGCMCSSGAEI